ncbi:hypothetical protein [Streptomyces sp. NPDC047097]|uniref:zinc finger domain-containing protein n=1 Tax=Streptomyces sp. NPDC047097 TaxID=3155260 RepID=UPI00340A3617
MTPAETAELLGFCAAFDRRTIGKTDVLAWQTVLHDVDFEPARQAVAQHYATETRWIMPADIRQAVRKHRADTADSIQGPGLPAEVPDADPDDVKGYLTALREQRTRAADGQQLKRRPVAELIAGTVEALPTIPAVEQPKPVRRPGPLGTRCPACQAAIGRPCSVEIGGTRRELGTPHNARKRAATGEPAEEPGGEQQVREASRLALARLTAGKALEDRP